ncbi:hypothetical protein [Dyadobacter frigoris]|uniref:hypothetical protein n=1 Tax=Dyadobacter frigoris TaxID=2576211 RepID=UPI001484E4D2|nr:hypothetical protein [Dyadobacter frigoris]
MFPVIRGILILVILFGNLQKSVAQMGATRKAIIQINGPDYTTGTSENGTKYITYEIKRNSKSSGSFDEVSAFYFKRLSGQPEFCYRWRVIGPVSETNEWIVNFSNKYVHLGKKLWKDYENNLLYSLEVDQDLCIVEITFDNRRQK